MFRLLPINGRDMNKRSLDIEKEKDQVKKFPN
jgi:hypothetical protein